MQFTYEFKNWKQKPANFISFPNVSAAVEKWKITFQQSSNAITSLKEFITTLICLNFAFIFYYAARLWERNETIYIYKKCFECLLHQSSASSASFAASFRFQIKNSPLFLLSRKFYLPARYCYMNAIKNRPSEYNWIWSINGIFSYYTDQIIASRSDFFQAKTRYKIIFKQLYGQFHFSKRFLLPFCDRMEVCVNDFPSTAYAYLLPLSLFVPIETS